MTKLNRNEIVKRLDKLAVEQRETRRKIQIADEELDVDPNSEEAAGTAVTEVRRLEALDLEEEELRNLLPKGPKLTDVGSDGVRRLTLEGAKHVLGESDGPVDPRAEALGRIVKALRDTAADRHNRDRAGFDFYDPAIFIVEPVLGHADDWAGRLDALDDRLIYLGQGIEEIDNRLAEVYRWAVIDGELESFMRDLLEAGFQGEIPSLRSPLASRRADR